LGEGKKKTVFEIVFDDRFIYSFNYFCYM